MAIPGLKKSEFPEITEIPESAFFDVFTSNNNYKITQEEVKKNFGVDLPPSPIVTDIETLREIDPARYSNIWLSAHTTAGDGGNGPFRSVTGASPGTYVDNNGTIIVPTGGDGSSAWLRQFNAVNGVYISWFGAVSDGTTDSYTAIQAAYDYSESSGNKLIQWDGNYAFGTMLSIAGDIKTAGDYARIPGSGTSRAAMRWIGGVSPMIELASTANQFSNISVFNYGDATDWVEMVEGSQRIYLDSMKFALPAIINSFSRSVIRCTGNRLGYSIMTNVNVPGAVAPRFIDIDGGGSANGITRFSISDSLFSNSDGSPMTLVYVKDETLEILTISNCSLISRAGAEFVIVDTRENPISQAIGTLNVTQCELENNQDSGERFFYLTNVDNFNFNHNQVAGGTGAAEYLGELVNSNLTSHDGNSYERIGTAIWDCDDDTRAVIGSNKWGANGTQKPTFTNPATGVQRYIHNSSGPTNVVLGTDPGGPHLIREIRATDASGLGIRVDVVAPSPGQMLTFIHTNARGDGGSVASASFFSGQFKSSGLAVAPAAGFSRAYMFFFNGSFYQEMYRSNADIPYV